MRLLFDRYLAEFRGTLARAQQLLAAFSDDAREAVRDSRPHGVLVGGLLDFAKGLHLAAGKVAGSVRAAAAASSTSNKPSSSQQDNVLGPEFTGSDRRSNAAGDGGTAEKGGAQAKKVLLSLGNRLGSFGESLGGEWLPSNRHVCHWLCCNSASGF